jgi:outer membrane lipoprotein-sorting protein
MSRLRRFVAAALVAASGIHAAAAAAPGSASQLLALVRERLQLTPVLRGEFEQTKTLAGFSHPLISRGQFVIARDRGVVWHTLEPFESTMVVTKTRLFTRAADGSTTDAIDDRTEPGLRQVNELVFALLAADVDKLAERFVVDGKAVGAQGWSLVLVPRDPHLAQFLSRATLAGGRFVDSATIEEAGNNVTRIRFDHQTASSTLAPEDAALFR